ncbi:MAG: hypothetical protein FWD16_02340 [Clostridia bacterium]|nr:hypothetical protein [Clostridia bacterium]
MTSKTILPNIPPMHYGNPSAVCFIGCVMRLMEYLGDPVERDEVFALSGAGLCFPWKYISACDEVSIIPEIPARTFGAFGYESQHLIGEAVADKQACFAKIKTSIDKNRPVIGFGITEKQPMACLIVGYDDNGLYTRSFWPPHGEPRNSEEYFYNTDWHGKCAGLLIVGEKTGERLTGAAAYKCITDWALWFRCCPRTVKAQGQEIFLNKHAFPAMVDWLLDDAVWENPSEGGKEQYLKQCGLLLLDHYRYQLWEYLKKLDAQYPGVVNPPAFAALERIGNFIPGAHTSDLWLHEAVDPALADFSTMKDRAMREKVADYVRRLENYDNNVQWTLFMPDFVKNQTKGFTVDSFEYMQMPALRFIGREGEEFADIEKRLEIIRTLDVMQEYKSGFDHDVLFCHHYGLTVENPGHGVWGRFMKADTPVPEGFVSIDFVPHDVPVAGPPYYSRWAFATFSGDMQAMHSGEGFDCDAMYDTTRNIILGDDGGIPYPEKYWHAEVFFEGCDKPSTGYLFSTGRDK